uniref:Ephrin-A3b n=1 Tax=Paramormyrops kingsleyae TaxID=1676925 RepID=A0A3B3SVQ6_9TELE
MNNSFFVSCIGFLGVLHCRTLCEYCKNEVFHFMTTPPSLRGEGYTVQVNVNDYLDIYCPHYNDSQRGGIGEQYVLYMVGYFGYRNCDPQLGFKRWECNRPHAPHAPIKFSEKFQRYSAFSLGYEFLVGKYYYYISTPTSHQGRSCLRLRVYVCCASTTDVDNNIHPTQADYTLRPNIKIHDIGECPLFHLYSFCSVFLLPSCLSVPVTVRL